MQNKDHQSHSCRVDKNLYRHEGRADKDPYRHDGRAYSLSLFDHPVIRKDLERNSNERNCY